MLHFHLSQLILENWAWHRYTLPAKFKKKNPQPPLVFLLFKVVQLITTFKLLSKMLQNLISSSKSQHTTCYSGLPLEVSTKVCIYCTGTCKHCDTEEKLSRSLSMYVTDFTVSAMYIHSRME